MSCRGWTLAWLNHTHHLDPRRSDRARGVMLSRGVVSGATATPSSISGRYVLKWETLGLEVDFRRARRLRWRVWWKPRHWRAHGQPGTPGAFGAR